MSNWMIDCDGYNICDVACGTGNLILTYLDVIGEEKAREILSQGRLYLYDLDAVALLICKTIISVKYGSDIAQYINSIQCDFLDKTVILPENSKVISNPPYSSIESISETWEQTQNIKNTKELYCAFMEKICSQAQSVVIITPFSFISSNKFYELRKLISEKGNGFIVSFDNVPGNIFCGRKHGIFNTNTSNSVRAAITVFNKSDTLHGFKTSHLICFKSTERYEVLKNSYLEKILPCNYQIVDNKNKMFKKINVRLESIFNKWITVSQSSLSNLTAKDGEYKIYMPNTCRYFTSASNKPLNRNGQITLSFDDEDKFNYAFCLINSSFAYWHWRIYDGGITYPLGLLEDIPTFYENLSEDDKLFMKNMTAEMISKKSEFIVTKNNVGLQENVKYPKEYRDRINRKFFDILGIAKEVQILDIIHSNMELEVSL
jgi:hypothetical protein